MTRRTHSSIDTLPADLRSRLTAMLTDGQWPADWTGPRDGKPTYDDLAEYCRRCGHRISRSAVGRWAKGLLAYERMRSAAQIARQVMSGLSEENASETQKAAAEIMTAQIIDLLSAEELSPKEISLVSSAIRDCTQVALKADQYLRSRLAEKAASAEKTIAKELRKKVDPETLKIIREQIYGIVQ
ncbi:MAG TPA: DUF3486 family protein [Anaerohalosphaeraceae bacterium]|nr:DUF3486 family protein [Anaerohalosphaeraceae bacterium]HQG06861.1 DUF3486 family protein [Anaerohalosphaeraceae bacterium]HQI08446.1 DUF3486 family protein [Anaerohalosphaeraceae bacterium]HQJ68765.1 DUF3486 family protein [Anaerohalosphaeraceae bacterium]